MDEAALIEKAARGDRDAFGSLYDRHASFVYNVALRMVYDHGEADELAQEAFVAAWKKLPGFRGGAAFRTWLYRIVVNRGVSLLRSRRPSQEMSDEAMSRRTDGCRFTEDDPARAAERRQAEERLRAFLDRLDPDRRAAVILREIEGLSYDEIAHITDVPVGTVRSRLARARDDLAAMAREERA